MSKQGFRANKDQQAESQRHRLLDDLVENLDAFIEQPPDRPTMWSRDPEILREYFSLSMVDHALRDLPLRPPLLSLTKDNTPLPVGHYTLGPNSEDPLLEDVIDPTKVSEAIASGVSVHFNMADRTFPGLRRLCQAVNRELGVPATADAFLTPPKSQGFDHHFDRVSSFIVQVEGTKTWELYEPSTPLPLSDYHPWQPEELSEDERSRIYEHDPVARFEMTPGQVLWLPRGWIHNVYSTSSHSLHYALGIPDVTGHTVARILIELLAENREFRTELPFQLWQSPELVPRISTLLEEVVAFVSQVSPEEVAERFTEQLHADMQPAVIRPVLAALGLPSESRGAALDDYGIVATTESEEDLTIHLGDRALVLDGEPKARFLAALNGDGNLAAVDETSSDELVDTLIQQGIARPL